MRQASGRNKPPRKTRFPFTWTKRQVVLRGVTPFVAGFGAANMIRGQRFVNKLDQTKAIQAKAPEEVIEKEARLSRYDEKAAMINVGELINNVIDKYFLIELTDLVWRESNIKDKLKEFAKEHEEEHLLEIKRNVKYDNFDNMLRVSLMDYIKMNFKN